jgi:hypothetical protein
MLRRDHRELAVTRLCVSNHLACLRWRGFVGSRRDDGAVFNFIANDRVTGRLGVVRG